MIIQLSVSPFDAAQSYCRPLREEECGGIEIVGEIHNSLPAPDSFAENDITQVFGLRISET